MSLEERLERAYQMGLCAGAMGITLGVLIWIAITF